MERRDFVKWLLTISGGYVACSITETSLPSEKINPTCFPGITHTTMIDAPQTVLEMATMTAPFHGICFCLQ